jgi:hypothetical protein
MDCIVYALKKQDLKVLEYMYTNICIGGQYIYEG